MKIRTAGSWLRRATWIGTTTLVVIMSVLWARSGWRQDRAYVITDELSMYEVFSQNGLLGFEYNRHPRLSDPKPRWHYSASGVREPGMWSGIADGVEHGWIGVLGVGVSERRPGWFAVTCSYPTLIVALLLPVMVRGLLVLRPGRGHGCCRSCGYDLRGSPGDSCPECGASGDSVVPPRRAS